MVSNETTIKLLGIGDKIVELFWEKDEMPNGDFQGCLEAQVMSAYYLGKEDQKNGN
jgi:hypothetical protein